MRSKSRQAPGADAGAGGDDDRGRAEVVRQRGDGVREGVGLAPRSGPSCAGSSGSVSTSNRFIICTAPSGSWPTAVSSDSMTASVPSITAFATSVTSARVEAGSSTIDINICVAVITGQPARFAARMMRFWVAGTRSIGIRRPDRRARP